MQEMCYILVRTDNNSISVVKANEIKHRPTGWGYNFTQEYVGSLNEKLGVSKAEAHAMEICSMFGTWDKYESNLTMLRKKMED